VEEGLGLSEAIGIVPNRSSLKCGALVQGRRRERWGIVGYVGRHRRWVMYVWHACHVRRRIHVCQIHAWHVRTRIHACHRRRIHA